MTDDKAIKDNSTAAEAELMKEWDQFMHDFVPEDINTIIVSPAKD